MLPEYALHCTIRGQKPKSRATPVFSLIKFLQINQYLIKNIATWHDLARALLSILHRNVLYWGSSHLLKRRLRKL